MGSVTISDGFSDRPFTLWLYVNEGSIDYPNNRSRLDWTARIYSDSGYNSYNLNNVAFMDVVINGSKVLDLNNIDYDFRDTNAGQYIQFGSGSTWVTHNSDGTKTASVSISADFNYPLEVAAASGNLSLTDTRVVPSKPATPTVSGIGQDYATINMVLPSNNGNAISDTALRIYDASSGGNLVWSDSSSSPITSVLAQGLDPSTNLWAEVQAKNVAGWSARSDRRAFTTLVATVPSKPATPTYSNLLADSADLEWVLPNLNGGTVTGFDIQVGTDTSFAAPDLTTTAIASALSKTLTLDFTIGRWARIRVNATAGSSLWSDPVFIGFGALPPDKPPAPTLISKNSTDVVVQIYETTINVAPVTGYLVYLYDYGTFTWLAGGSSMELTREFLGELTSGEEYGIRVIAESPVGNSPASDWLVFTAASGPLVANDAGDAFLQSELLVANDARNGWLPGAEMFVANDARDGWLPVG